MSDRTAPWPCGPRRGPLAYVTPVRAPTGKVRWLTTLDPDADAVYAARVAAVVPAIERHLGPEVIADRARPSVGARAVRVAPWGPARRRWRTLGGRRLDREVRALVVADVRDCFPSIGPPIAARALARSGAPPEAIERIAACLRAFADEGVRGLPVGPTASAPLANVVLARLDDALRDAGVPHLRWVDDVLAFAPSRREARLALEGLRRASAEIGLELHPSKTRIVVDPHEARMLVGRADAPGSGPGMA